MRGCSARQPYRGDRIAGCFTAPRSDASGTKRTSAELDDETRGKVLNTARTFNDFTRHNDSHGEHDCFFFQVNRQRYFAKIDYYDRSMEYGSENPADPAVTTRVLTIGDAESY